MKVVYTGAALRDLDDILRYIATGFPVAYRPFEIWLRASSSGSAGGLKLPRRLRRVPAFGSFP